MSSTNPIIARAHQVRKGDGPVPSPCLSVCRMEKGSALCAGCFRTLEEIAAWGGMPDAAKRAVWQQIGARAGSSTAAGEPK